MDVHELVDDPGVKVVVEHVGVCGELVEEYLVEFPLEP